MKSGSIAAHASARNIEDVTDSAHTNERKQPDDASRIGRLVRAIQRIEKERDAELADAPQSIHARSRKRLHKAAEGYPPHIVNAAWAAVEAMRPETKEPEGE